MKNKIYKQFFSLICCVIRIVLTFYEELYKIISPPGSQYFSKKKFFLYFCKWNFFVFAQKYFLYFWKLNLLAIGLKRFRTKFFELEKFFKVTLKSTQYISGNRTLKTSYIFYINKFSHISGDNLQSSKNKNFLCFSIFQDDQVIK